LKAFNIAF